MTLDDAHTLIRTQLKRMDSVYGGVVFDEWVIMAITASGANVQVYEGPRADAYKRTLKQDIAPLRAEMTRRDYVAGDFEFAPDASGVHYDAFMRLGEGAYLICNHTDRTMSGIRAGAAWKQAQAVWFLIGEAFRADPLA